MCENFPLEKLTVEGFNGKVFACTSDEPSSKEVEFILNNFELIKNRCLSSVLVGEHHNLDECKCEGRSDYVEAHRLYLKDDETDVELYSPNLDYRYLEIESCNHCGTWQLSD